MVYTIFEDKAENFYPFTINHSIIEIRGGAFSLLERVKQQISNEDKIILVVRDNIKDIVSERHPDIDVNPEIIPPSYLCRAGILNVMDSKSCVKLEKEISLSDFKQKISNTSNEEYLWDYLKLNNLQNDRDKFDMSIKGDFHQSCIFVGKNNIHIAESAKISAGAILDATDGPIIIDNNAFIDIGALVKGPTYIGRGSTINPGSKIRGNVSIGPSCKVGGEVEDTTFHGYSNKQHDGYMGHSYIGEWVNLGANTNNSDLKNNYSNVKFQIGDNLIDTKQMFLGCMIGDYTKTGISTMINTGTYIGLGCNLFGGDFQPKQVESFSWGTEERMNLDKFLKTLKIVKERRNSIVSKTEKALITKFYNFSKNTSF